MKYLKGLATLIAIVLCTPTYAQDMMRASTLFCSDIDEMRSIIKVHVAEGDEAGFALGLTKVEDGTCSVMTVGFPADPKLLNFSFIEISDNMVYGALPVKVIAGGEGFVLLQLQASVKQAGFSI